MKKSARLAVSAVLACVALPAAAAWVAEKDASNAAAAFVANDAVGRAVLAGCSVKSIDRRGNLWIVSLSPSGHVIVGASDLFDPIVGFSKNDFAEPDKDSPAYAYLAGVDASLAEMEAKGGERHARWDRLLMGGRKGGTRDAGSPGTVVVPPFLESHYNQWQPYNDYAPVYAADPDGLGSYRVYRGRCPCGCVATAAAQGLRHFRWPARIDRVDSFSHDFTGTNGIATTFPIRFDGHLPIDWASLADEYESYIGGYDLRGKVAEAVRHPVARLILFADVLAKMSFADDGSSANYGAVASGVAEWYTTGTRVAPNDARVLSDIASGVPVQVTVPGHAVVGHGWAADGEESYIYLNYGWGGSNDGYYNIGSSIQEVYVGHYPRAKPQLDPLPKVSGNSLTLDWHFPDFYTNSLSGFTVSISKTATTPSTFLDDFSASAGVSSYENGIYVTTDSVGYDGSVLFTKPIAAGTYTFPGSYTLTSASVLTFKLYSFAALGAEYKVEARFDGGDWTTLCTPALKTNWGGSGWSTESVYLGPRGGQTAQFRISNSHSGSYYPQEESRILIDDFRVADVLAPGAPEVRTVGKTARSLALTGLDAGAAYSFVVTPDISGALVDGESSEPVTTSIAGTRNTPIPGGETYSPTVEWDTQTLTALGMPEIRSVSSVAEGFYRECGLGTTTFYVECSETVTNLAARPSHLALVGDGDVTVTPSGNGRFTVRVSPSGITEANARSRMILTLAATDSNGTTAYRDVSLRFAPVAATAVTIAATTSSGSSFTVDVPYEWIDQYSLVPSGSSASAYEGALASDADADGDGFPNWAEYICGSSPIDPASKLIATIRMENGQPIVGYEPHGLAAGFKAIVKGTDDLTEDFSRWQITTGTTSLHYFRVEIVPE